MKKIQFKVYLKSQRRPFKFEFDSEKQIDDFYTSLRTQDIIRLGPLIFERSEFKFAVMT